MAIVVSVFLAKEIECLQCSYEILLLGGMLFESLDDRDGCFNPWIRREL